MTPAQEAKARVYRELGYRPAGMVGVNLAVARPMKTRKGFTVPVIAPDGKTVDTLVRYR